MLIPAGYPPMSKSRLTTPKKLKFSRARMTTFMFVIWWRLSPIGRNLCGSSSTLPGREDELSSRILTSYTIPKMDRLSLITQCRNGIRRYWRPVSVMAGIHVLAASSLDG